MLDLYRTLTEDEAGVLKAQLGEDDLQLLRKNPFHITDSDIKVKRQLLFSPLFFVTTLASNSI